MSEGEQPKDCRRGKLVEFILACLTGLLVGLVSALFRMGVTLISGLSRQYIRWAGESTLQTGCFFLSLAVPVLLSALLLRWEPLIGGSGIPQVNAFLQNRLKTPMKSGRVLLCKLLGGWVTLGSGLTLGREGPSVQLGASVGDLIGAKGKSQDGRRRLVIGGASAGLASAFHAPLSGLLFSMEELKSPVTPQSFMVTASAVFSADWISIHFFGARPVMKLPQLPEMTEGFYGLCLLLGLFCGLSGVLFNAGIRRGKILFSKMNCPKALRLAIPFLATGVALLLRPDLFGSGEGLLPGILGATPSEMGYLVGIYALKWLLLMVAFCSGLPGGIFFPLLILGSMVGSQFGLLSQSLGLAPAEWVPAFAVVAMAGHFSAIVRSPITGILLIVEMTGLFTYFLPIGLVVGTAWLTAEALRSEPVYDTLLDLLCGKDNPSESA